MYSLFFSYKDLSLETPEIQTQVKQRIQRKLQEMGVSNSTHKPKKSKQRNALQFLFNKQRVVEDTTATDEIEAYEAEPLIDTDRNPLLWWKDHEIHYPSLAKLARIYLSIPSTSTPSERVFSDNGNIVTQKRNCLSPDNVNKLVFLSQNAEVLFYLEEINNK